MNLNEIKIGAKLACDAKIAEIDGDVVYIEFSAHKKFRLAAELVELLDAQMLSPTNGTKNSDPAPKYDPCRLFRKGDRVQVKRRNGRCSGKYGEYLREAYCLVAEDEDKNELVRVFHNSSEYRLDPAYLELVTPVEEFEPYRLEHRPGEWLVVKKDNKLILSSYNVGIHTNAKAAAEAECARLNAEYRKERENG